MAYQGIGTGTTPNDGTGDDLLTGAIKINSNFQELYSYIPVSGFTAIPTISTVTSSLNIIDSNYVTYSSNIVIIPGVIVTVSPGSKVIILG